MPSVHLYLCAGLTKCRENEFHITYTLCTLSTDKVQYSVNELLLCWGLLCFNLVGKTPVTIMVVIIVCVCHSVNWHLVLGIATFQFERSTYTTGEIATQVKY